MNHPLRQEHPYQLEDCPDDLLDGWREDAEEVVWWKTDVYGFDQDGAPRDCTGDEDPMFEQALGDARLLVAAQSVRQTRGLNRVCLLRRV